MELELWWSPWSRTTPAGSPLRGREAVLEQVARQSKTGRQDIRAQSAPGPVCGALLKNQIRRRRQFGQGLVDAADLDRPHAQHRRRLAVDAQVVEVDAIGGVDLQPLAHHLGDARVRLSR